MARFFLKKTKASMLTQARSLCDDIIISLELIGKSLETMRRSKNPDVIRKCRTSAVSNYARLNVDKNMLNDLFPEYFDYLASKTDYKEILSILVSEYNSTEQEKNEY